jgi:predicted ferric reductase
MFEPILGVVNTQALWYLTRGTGIVTLLLLTGTMVLGIANAMRWTPRRSQRFVVSAIHRNVSLLVVVFLTIHVATSVIDGYVPIKVIDVVVPFISAYKPLWLGLGALALDLTIAIIITSLLRKSIGQRTWRAIHWLAYAAWPIALIHSVGIGTDSRSLWMYVIFALCIGSVLAAVWWMGQRRREELR